MAGVEELEGGGQPVEPLDLPEERGRDGALSSDKAAFAASSGHARLRGSCVDAARVRRRGSRAGSVPRCLTPRRHDPDVEVKASPLGSEGMRSIRAIFEAAG